MNVINTETFQLLLSWYKKNKRTLPWRDNPTPYRVWISEIMLQQTRVEAAKDYYLNWMKKFPSVSTLASSSEEEVLKAWEGLGYYSRARNLYKAARIIQDNYGGELPRDKTALETIPGIGEYTAGAILSIAFDTPEPAVDGNVLRVVSRLTANAFDITKPTIRTEVGDMLRPFMKKGETSDFTQALFELGALICLPNTMPKCDLCPLAKTCQAHLLGKESEYPTKVKKQKQKVEKLTIFVVEYNGKFAIRKRPVTGLLANLWELPNLPGHLQKSDIPFAGKEECQMLPPAKHVFSHIIWDMIGYFISLSTPIQDPEFIFATEEELAGVYSLPSAFSSYRKYCHHSFSKLLDKDKRKP